MTLVLAACASAAAQNPTTPGTKATIVGTPAAIAASKQDPEAVERGGALFVAKCGGCHGATAKGTNRAPDLVRSLLVLDDEKGILIAPVLRDGRPAKGMPKLGLTEPQISDIVAWMHVQTYAADHRNTYLFLDALTGDAKAGEAYFNGKGTCNKCHNPAEDLKGIGAKYDAHNLQGRWLQPRGFGRGGGGGRGGRGGGGGAAAVSRSTVTVTVTMADGKKLEGTLDRIDDFNVALRDASGEFHSINRDGNSPKVEVHDPLRAHVDLLKIYTDTDIHNVTAYLASLK
jgi:mono/diheme cytochrome c family protein/small nuclear ribonucleoprotein (snRNP)-like protein